MFHSKAAFHVVIVVLTFSDGSDCDGCKACRPRGRNDGWLAEWRLGEGLKRAPPGGTTWNLAADLLRMTT